MGAFRILLDNVKEIVTGRRYSDDTIKVTFGCGGDDAVRVLLTDEQATALFYDLERILGKA